MLLFIKHRQRLAPGRMLFVVDLAEIDNGSLHRLAGNQAMVFYDAEAAMIVSSETDDEAEKRPQLRKSG